MKKLFFLLFMILPFSVESQTNDFTNYDAGMEFPYGQKNPSAPEELNDFAPMIGTCKCKSLNRNPDGTWQDTVPMIWTFKYIMNGTAIQDMVGGIIHTPPVSGCLGPTAWYGWSAITVFRGKLLQLRHGLEQSRVKI